ncbi:MAG: radical SAM protein [Verrucomicrobia bacterium]|nr:radical SAM protein [Verrucomicrobiota bacterium]
MNTTAGNEVGVSDTLMQHALSRVADFKRFREEGLICRNGEFFPSVHYPPITMYSEVDEDALFETYTLPQDRKFDVYAHIPFCKQRCVFCHYPVMLGKKQAEMDQYLAAMEKEMDIYMRRLGIERIKVRSILVGGGTPSYLSPQQLIYFLNFFTRRLDLSECEQFNWDVDPSTLVGEEGLERLRILRDYGSDRLTLGIQSLDPTVLEIMNRPHDKSVALEAIENSQNAGYQINIEFIFGHPGETLASWVASMREAVTLGTEEIQLYRLKVEAYGDYQAPVKKLIEKRPDKVPSHDEAIMMKQFAIDILAENGYQENLRRVYTKERKHYSCYAHNQCCMLYDEVGFGLTAFSSLRDRFILNTQNFGEYYQAIEEGRLPLNRGLVRDSDQQIRWSIVLPLKNRDVYKKTFQRLTGGESLDHLFRPKIERLKAYGLLQETERNLGLTELGTFFADEVAHQFHHEDYIPHPREAYASGPLNPYLDTDPHAVESVPAVA